MTTTTTTIPTSTDGSDDLDTTLTSAGDSSTAQKGDNNVMLSFYIGNIFTLLHFCKSCLFFVSEKACEILIEELHEPFDIFLLKIQGSVNQAYRMGHVQQPAEALGAQDGQSDNPYPESGYIQVVDYPECPEYRNTGVIYQTSSSLYTSHSEAEPVYTELNLNLSI